MAGGASSSSLRLVLVVALLLAALGAGAFLGWRLGGPPDLSVWDADIDHAATEAGVDRALLAAMVAAESGGRPGVVSAKGAHGLLQILPATARQEAERLGIVVQDEASLREPRTNLRIGAAYLARLLDRYDGSEVFALAAYNAGPTAVGRWRRRMPHLAPMDVLLREGYEETRRHVVRVLGWRDHYRR